MLEYLSNVPIHLSLGRLSHGPYGVLPPPAVVRDSCTCWPCLVLLNLPVQIHKQAEESTGKEKTQHNMLSSTTHIGNDRGKLANLLLGRCRGGCISSDCNTTVAQDPIMNLKS